MLPWIKVWPSLRTHPKALALDEELGRRRTWTHVVELWMWAAEFRPTGDLTGLSPKVVANAAGWRGSADDFCAALCRAGFVSEGFVLNGWTERQTAHVEAASDGDKKATKRAADRKRAQDRRDAARLAATDSDASPESRDDEATNGDEKATTRDDEATNPRRDAESGGFGQSTARAPTRKTEIEIETEIQKIKEPSGDCAPGLPGMVAPKVKRPRKEPADPQLAPDRAAFLAKHRALFDAPLADFSGKQVFAFAAARAKHGQEVLLDVLDRLATHPDPFVRKRALVPVFCCGAEGVNLATAHGAPRPAGNASMLGPTGRNPGWVPPPQPPGFDDDPPQGARP